MANTVRTYIGDGSRVLYPIDFELGYLREEYVFVYTGDDYSTQLPYTWQNPSEIELDVAIPLGEVLTIRRIVPRHNLINSYTNGANLHKKELNDSYLQSLMILEEISDGYISVDSITTLVGGAAINGDLDMLDNQIKNLKAAVEPTDAVNLQQVSELLFANGIDGVVPVVAPKQLGDGVLTTFYTPATGNSNVSASSFLVHVAGVYYRPQTDFIIDQTTGNITFVVGGIPTAPVVGAEIDITYYNPVALDNPDTALITATGTTIPRSLADRAADTINVKDFGALGYPNNDTQAFIDALAYAGNSSNTTSVVEAQGKFLISGDGLEIPRGVTLQGSGIDYWDTFRPDETRLIKRMASGTHLLFTGTGNKIHSAINLTNPAQPKVVSGDTIELLDFTNNDSVGGVSATARDFSCAIILNENSQLKNLRIVPEFDGIDGYNDFVTTDIGSDWDVGIWCRGAYEGVIDNVQSVGYWRMAGTLITENDGTYEESGNNPERLRVSKLASQGIRGLSIRNGAQIKVLSNTDTTITCRYYTSFTLTSQNEFRIFGTSQVFTFTGYSIIGSDIQLTGVSPNLPASVSAIRSPSLGNNFSGTVFNDCYFSSFEHSSGIPSQDLPHGLPISGAKEMSGYAMRGIRFFGTKFQTVYDVLNTLYIDCRDTKLIGCQYENGVLVAYDNSTESGYTENLRLTNTYISSSVDKTEFTPRELFNDHDMFPTQFTDGSTIIRPSLDGKNIELQTYDGQIIAEWRISDGNITFYDYNGKIITKRIGSSGELQQYGAGYVLRRISDGANYMQFFSASGNGSCIANWTVGGSLNVTSNILPLTDNTTDIGRSSEGIKYIYMHDQTTGLPRRVFLDNGVITVL